jgi:hypothetical protein
MAPETTGRRWVKFLLWQWIISAYCACLTPIWLEGVTLSSVSGVLCTAILVTYVLTRIYHDLQLVADRLARWADGLVRFIATLKL